MQELDDISLLRRYAADKSEEAFAALVSRHVNLVYGAALRQVGNPQLAQEVSQSVFLLLSKKAGAFGKDVILSGWLHRAANYIAADAVKAETRRRNRETAAMQPLYEPGAASPHHEIEPILDQAMDELGESDRNAILLRYFEKKSLKDLGARFGVSEDAAQKRVTRALEKLRQILERKGSAVTSTALTSALIAFAGQAAPSSLAASIVTVTAASAAAPIALSLFTTATLNFMAMTKTKLAVGTVALLAAVSTPIALQQTAINDLRVENTALRTQMQQIEAQPAAVEAAEPEIQRLRAEAAEVHQLRAQVAALNRNQTTSVTPRAAASSTSTTPMGNPDDPAFNPMNRQTLGDKLVAEGKFAEGLEHYLWCFDEGIKYMPSYHGVRGSFLLMRLKELAERYPAAREALVARRDAAEAQVINGNAADTTAINNLNLLYEHLNEPDRILALFDQLPAEHRARKELVEIAGDSFARASRYQDIVASGNPEAVLDRHLMTAKAAYEHDKSNESFNNFMRRRIVDSGGRGIEALAAVGQIDRAKSMADKVFKFDQSPETKGELLKYAQRAGNANVVEHIRNK